MKAQRTIFAATIQSAQSSIFCRSIIAVTLAGFVSTTKLFAGDAGNWYVGTDLGINFQQDLSTTILWPEAFFKGSQAGVKFDAGERGDLKLGYNIEDWLAVELEAGVSCNRIKSYGQDAVSDADFYQIPAMANVVLSYPLHGNWSVYAGSGVGGIVGRWNLGVNLIPTLPIFTFHPGHVASDTDFVMACQAMTGIQYTLGKRWEFLVGYKFLSAPAGHNWTINGESVKTDPTFAHSITASVLFRF